MKGKKRLASNSFKILNVNIECPDKMVHKEQRTKDLNSFKSTKDLTG